MRNKTLFKPGATFVEVIITIQKNVSKGLESKSKKLMQLVLWRTNKRNGRLENVLDIDLNIKSLQNIQIHKKIIRNGEIKYVLMKELIVHATTAKKK